MREREGAHLLQGKIQMDDAYLGGKFPGGKASRGSENKIPIVADILLNDANNPIHAKITAVSGFSSEAIGAWAAHHLEPGSAVLSDGLACFRAVTTAGCSHHAVVTGGQHPKDLPAFRWINTLLSNLKTSFSGTFHALNFDKYARRYLGSCCFRFNRHFKMVEIAARIANAVCCCTPCTERDLRLAESYGQSSTRFVMSALEMASSISRAIMLAIDNLQSSSSILHSFASMILSRA
jgi:hypothetical protein